MIKPTTLAIATVITASLPSQAVEPSLAKTWEKEFRIGSAVGRRILTTPDSAVATAARHRFNQFTSENEMKWGPIHPEPGTYNFELADAFVSFAQHSNAAIHGHVLVWHSQTPDWVFEDDNGEPATRELLLKRMQDHIATVMPRYQGKVASWDVVNEALNEDGSLRQSKWLTGIGEDFIEAAFQHAHATDPQARLVYNDYGLAKPKKRDGAVEIVKRIQAAGIPIHAVGMQGHWRLEHPTIKQIEQSILAFHALGVKVMISELDVDVLPAAWEHVGADISKNFEWKETLDPYTKGLPAEVQAKLTERYRQIFELFAKHSDKIVSVTFWGVNDGNSWLNNFPVKGRTNYPLLFGRDDQPKPAFTAVLEVAGKSAPDTADSPSE